MSSFIFVTHLQQHPFVALTVVFTTPFQDEAPAAVSWYPGRRSGGGESVEIV